MAEPDKRVLEPNPKVLWDAWCDDCRLIRGSIGKTYPETFHDDGRRMWGPGGFQRPMPACKRQWHARTGKANVVTLTGLDEDHDMPGDGLDAFRMMTLRSNDQFDTTVFGYDDRFRGIKGTRDALLMDCLGIDRLGLTGGAMVRVETVADDGGRRELPGLTIVDYDIPVGYVGVH